jgi:hypothetical protein
MTKTIVAEDLGEGGMNRNSLGIFSQRKYFVCYYNGVVIHFQPKEHNTKSEA